MVQELRVRLAVQTKSDWVMGSRLRSLVCGGAGPVWGIAPGPPLPPPSLPLCFLLQLCAWCPPPRPPWCGCVDVDGASVCCLPTSWHTTPRQGASSSLFWMHLPPPTHPHNHLLLRPHPTPAHTCPTHLPAAQLKVSPVKVFVVHVEAVTADGNVHRVSVSNMYSADALKV